MRSGVFRVMVGCGLACSGCYSLFRVMWQEAVLCMRRMRPGRVVLPRSLVISPAVLQSLLPASSAVSPGIMDGMWLLSGACILFTLTMFSSGLSDLRVMVSKRTVDNVQFLPFLTTDLNNLGWLYYGFLKGDGTLITVNSIGASLQTVYIVAFILYSAEKRPPIYQVLLSLGVLVLGYIYFYLWIPDVGARLNQLGLFCSVFTISMYLSPLTDL
ncbi:LOW QUALITY PROTEIN: sugar transporter SWEET1, partial [Hyla sarda]|uniref:LOW QUALITY PROTEIN: sugar transporter SWEET1 n=1 Tax=Hyla sarda TaxID=327740 RepID=UPI0024C42F56